LGWVNPLAREGESRYKKGLVLDFLLRAVEDYEKNKGNAGPYFLILDEMNLAHIEYYFADFLSVLESGRDEDGWTKEAIKLHEDDDIEENEHIPKEIKLPPNLYIIGTLNTDETTKSLSPKVLDRGFVLEFGEVDMEGYPPGSNAESGTGNLVEKILAELRNPFDGGYFLSHVGNKGLLNEKVEEFKNNGALWKHLIALNSLLKPHELHFGYRVIDEIALFVLAAEKSEVARLGLEEAFDLAVCSKVLPKFYGTRARLEKPLWKVIKWAGVPFNPESGKELETIEGFIGKLEEQIKSKNQQNSKTEERPPEAGDTGNTEGETPAPAEPGAQANEISYPHTALKALRMLRGLYEEGFASYL